MSLEDLCKTCRQLIALFAGLMFQGLRGQKPVDDFLEESKVIPTFFRGNTCSRRLIVWASVLSMTGCMPFHSFMQTITPPPLTAERASELTQKFAKTYWQEQSARIEKGRAFLMSKPLEASIWMSLDAETNRKNGAAPLDRLMTPKDYPELMVYSTWLKWRILTMNADPRFSYAYAANLIQMKDADGKGFLKEAAIFFFHARLSLKIDGTRCVDRSSPDAVQSQFESTPRMQALIEQLSRMPQKERATYLLEAVGLEEYRGERPLNEGICQMGIQTAMRALASGKLKFEEDDNKGDRGASNPSLGKTVYFSGDGIKPNLIDESTWRLKRREILNEQVKVATGMLQ